MNLPVDQANSGAKYEFWYVFMVKVKFLKSNFPNIYGRCFESQDTVRQYKQWFQWLMLALKTCC